MKKTCRYAMLVLLFGTIFLLSIKIPLVSAQTFQGPCFGIANQGVAARIKGTNQLIAGATISSTRDAGAVTCAWGGQTVSSSGSCITGSDGLCEINPLNCGSSTGSLFTYRGSHPDYTCEETKHTTMNNRDNSVAIVECMPNTLPSPSPAVQAQPILKIYSVSGNVLSCTLEASGWATAALNTQPTVSIGGRQATWNGNSYTLSNLKSGPDDAFVAYDMLVGSLDGYTGPFDSCSAQSAYSSTTVIVPPSQVKNLYYKQISTSTEVSLQKSTEKYII